MDGFIAGCIGGGVGTVVGFPLDTIKCRLQTQGSSGFSLRYRGAFHCGVDIIRTEGVRALFKGMSARLLTSAGQNSLAFGTYRKCVSYLSPAVDEGETAKRVPLSTSMVAAIIAGIVQAPVSNNIELIKLRLQMHNIGIQYYSRFHSAASPSTVAGPLKTVQAIIATEGWRGLQKGLVITTWRDAISYMCYFPSYEYLCRRMAGANSMNTLSVFQLAFAGGIAGTMMWVSTFPLDVVKSRIQADGVEGLAQYSGSIDCFRKSYRTEGWTVFFRGLGTTVVRAFKVNAVMFVSVTMVLQYLQGEASEAVL